MRRLDLTAFLRAALPLALALSLLALAQEGKKPRADEKEETPAKKADGETEEKPPLPMKSPVLEVDEEDKGTPAPAINLAQAATEATDPDVQALFRKLATPAESLVAKVPTPRGTATIAQRIRPIPHYITKGADIEGQLTVRLVDKGDKEASFKPSAFDSIQYYEQVVGEEVEEFLKKHGRGEGELKALEAAEVALNAALRFHRSEQEDGVRRGPRWKPLETQLRQRLADVLLRRIRATRDWRSALKIAKPLAAALPVRGGKEEREAVKALEGVLEKAVASARPAEARQHARDLETLFPGSGVAGPVTRKAEALLADAAAKQKSKDPAVQAQARKKVDEARQWDPNVKDPEGTIEKLAPTGNVLRVGVRELPTYFAPGWAVTDSELRCLDLLYEGLLQLVPDEEGRLYYRPQLAQGRPRVIALGRRFVLPNAKWSDGTPITNAAVRTTLNWMDGPNAGLRGSWRELLDDVRGESNAREVSVRLKRGFLDPQALMTFKLLPPTYPGSEKGRENFATNKPIGSGPFRLVGKKENKPGPDYLVFRANRFYGNRGGPGPEEGESRPSTGRGPLLDEIQIHSPSRLDEALENGEIDLALDLTAEQAGKLDGKGFQVRSQGLPKETNRRIYFLAVNCRHRLLKLPAMRLALARAIPREAILNEVYRKGLTRPVHTALGGPYPVTSWASDPALVKKGDRLAPDIHDAELARRNFKEALAQAGLKEARFTLLYPAGDRQLEKAMEALCTAANKALPGLTLTKEAKEPHDLRKEAQPGKEWQLAYFHYDFPDGAFWLWPLLGEGPTGENFMGYNGPLRDEVHKAVGSRYFPRVKAQAHAIHRTFTRSEMPFIPLWQLTPLMAWKKGAIEYKPFELNAPFARIAEWSVNR